MKYAILVLILLLISVSVVGCSKKRTTRLVEGGLYASPRKDNPGYNVIKILKIDGGGYHIRVYSNVFEKVPDSIDPEILFMVGMDEGNDKQDPGMGHIPIGKENFEKWPLVCVVVMGVSVGEGHGSVPAEGRKRPRQCRHTN